MHLTGYLANSIYEKEGPLLAVILTLVRHALSKTINSSRIFKICLEQIIIVALPKKYSKMY